MTLVTIFSKRDYTNRVVDQALRFSVDSFRWSAIGGPVDATITAQGTIKALWGLLDYLRSPVVIKDEHDTPCWWGYVFSVELQVGGITFGVSLDRMANKVKVTYSYIAPGSQQVGDTKTTAATTDSESAAEYGTKEYLHSLSGASDAQALQIRDTILARQKYPIPTIAFGASGDNQATITCAGWFDTLSWQLYANTGVSTVSTTTQISAIVTSIGQFIAATDIENASGVTSSEFRDGTTTGLDEVLDLLKTGTTNNRRLLATVNQDRRLCIHEEPARPTNAVYFVTAAGEIETGYSSKTNKIKPHLAGSLVTGQWAALKDIIPATVDLTHLADPSMILIEEIVWSGGQLTITPRDMPGYLELE